MDKQKIASLVDGKDFTIIIDMAQNNPKKVIRHLIRLTYTKDNLLRWKSIETLGLVSKEIAKNDPEVIRDIIRRFLWSMNDESGGQSWSAPQAIAEIIYNNPDLFADLGPMMISSSMNEEMFQPGMLWAVGRLKGKVEYINEVLPDIIKFLEAPKPYVRGYAAWAIGELGVRGSLDKLTKLVVDQSIVDIYIDGDLYQKTVGEIAYSSIEKLN
ncbi:MAG: PBS lyase [Firmicutes bacterium]|nr:PBS lyase [Bacillota bacterium]